MSVHNSLNFHDVYPCPVCLHGQISNMTLMEAMSCNFCQHIFTVNLEQQVLKMADSQLPLTWRWNGKIWQRLQREGTETNWVYWLAGMIFLVILPPSLIALAAYLFPPLPDTPLSWFPLVWTLIAFVTHLAFFLWLIIEYYQFPLWMYLNSLRRRFLVW